MQVHMTKEDLERIRGLARARAAVCVTERGLSDPEAIALDELLDSLPVPITDNEEEE